MECFSHSKERLSDPGQLRCTRVRGGISAGNASTSELNFTYVHTSFVYVSTYIQHLVGSSFHHVIIWFYHLWDLNCMIHPFLDPINSE